MSRGSLPTEACERRTLLDPQDLQRTIARLCSQVLESAGDSHRLLLLGIPTRGAALARVLAGELQRELGHPVDQGVLDPTFHRDDLERVGTRLAEPTALPVPVEGREVVLVDDVVFTGRTVRAALEALHLGPSRLREIAGHGRSRPPGAPHPARFCWSSGANKPQ